MSASLVYRSPLAYELVMLLLYGRHYWARYRVIAGLIAPGASALELCCGPGVLFGRYLKRKRVDYLGLDLNARFVHRIGRMGGRAQVWDLSSEQPLPAADYVVMQASLYHFLPDAGPVIERMRRAAHRAVIVAEPIRNLSTSRVPLLSALARRATDAGQGARPLRFTEESLDGLLGGSEAGLRESFCIPGGREKVYVLEPSHAPKVEAGILT